MSSFFASDLPPRLGPLAEARPRRRPSTVFTRVRDLAIVPGDSHDVRLQKRLQVTMAAASVLVVGAWGGLFVAMGHPGVALWPFGFSIVTVLMLAYVAATKRFDGFRVGHPLLVMLSPFCLHWQLGGFRGSGGAILWCLLAPVAGMMFSGPRRSIPLFFGMVALVLVGCLREGPLAPGAFLLTPAQVSAQFAFNTIGFVVFLYAGTTFFVSRIDAEKARSDRLLLNVLPRSIGERLKRDEALIADRHPSATVLFCDIVGFTPLAARLAPEGLVLLLNEIFSAFDAIVDRLGLEKIKTIGDAYMLVGGVPGASLDHATRVAEAALAMRDFLVDFSRARGLELSMRIGIHSGPVVAGVIGRRKFTYDLWGDTVNTASRMESHGEPDRIHVTEATRALLADRFLVAERGSVQVKGKGEMRTFWLEGRRASPSTGAGHADVVRAAE